MPSRSSQTLMLDSLVARSMEAVRASFEDVPGTSDPLFAAGAGLPLRPPPRAEN